MGRLIIIHLRRRNRGRRVSHSHSQIYEKNMIPPFQADMSFQNSKSIPNCPNNVEIERSLIHYIYRIYMIYIYELKSKNSIFEFSITIIIVRAASRLYFDIYTYVNRYFKLDFTNYTNKLYIVAA